ncbi:MAG: RDD family protein [Jiangellaceae bacterium]
MSLPPEAYAGLVSRLVALAIDVVVVTVAAGATVALVVGGTDVLLRGTPGWATVTSAVVVGLLPTVYFSLSWWTTGQTLGNMTAGVAIRRSDGAHLAFSRSLVRALIGLALAPVWLLGMVLVLVDHRRRSLLDYACGTVVVYQADHGRQ